MIGATSGVHKKEIIFVAYDEVIKNPYPLLLKLMVDKYKEFYSTIVDFSKIEQLDMNNLMRMCMHRNDINVLKYVAKEVFDFDKSLDGLKTLPLNLYADSELLKFGTALPILASQKFTEAIYIYSKKYDPRIRQDIQNIFGSMNKITYMVGEDIREVVKGIPNITLFVFSDALDVVKLAETDKIVGSTVLLATYGYNYKPNKNGLEYKYDIKKLEKERKFKFGEFVAKDLDIESFSGLV